LREGIGGPPKIERGAKEEGTGKHATGGARENRGNRVS